MRLKPVTITTQLPPSSWAIIDVLRTRRHRGEWAALMCADAEHPGTQWAWVAIPGTHRGWRQAWQAMGEALETRHLEADTAILGAGLW